VGVLVKNHLAKVTVTRASRKWQLATHAL